jgi:transcriptional regulator with XRE-family HTH domain
MDTYFQGPSSDQFAHRPTCLVIRRTDWSVRQPGRPACLQSGISGRQGCRKGQISGARFDGRMKDADRDRLSPFDDGLPFRDEPPPGWRASVTGRPDFELDPALELLGRYVRRSRYIVGRSQQSLANEIGIPQSQVSRLERALAPSMDVERLAWLGGVLGRAFPLGYCPHQHVCRWQELAPRTLEAYHPEKPSSFDFGKATADLDRYAAREAGRAKEREAAAAALAGEQVEVAAGDDFWLDGDAP